MKTTISKTINFDIDIDLIVENVQDAIDDCISEQFPYEISECLDYYGLLEDVLNDLKKKVIVELVGAWKD